MFTPLKYSYITDFDIVSKDIPFKRVERKPGLSRGKITYLKKLLVNIGLNC